jgi:hypothetical protein
MPIHPQPSPRCTVLSQWQLLTYIKQCRIQLVALAEPLPKLLSDRPVDPSTGPHSTTVTVVSIPQNGSHHVSEREEYGHQWRDLRDTGGIPEM